MNRMPNFIVIGAMKCATSTLHDQLAQQPSIFMSTPKEPNFFSNDSEYQRGIDAYASLYEAAGPNDLCGESSTHYTKLPTYPDTLERMRLHVPEARLVYVMRHPVARLISHYVHEWSERTIEVPIDEAIDRYPRLIEYGQYAMQLRPFLETYGPRRILPVFFSRLQAHSQAELERVSEFIGYEGHPRWNAANASSNVSAQRLRRSPWRDALVKAPVLSQIRRNLIPKSVRDWVKGFWTLKQKPSLSEAAQYRVRAIFDEDLAELGRWLGIQLNCDNFDLMTVDAPRTWHSNVAEDLHQLRI